MDLSVLSQYNTLDLILVAVLAISVLVGLIRGVVREVLSVASWAISIYLALRFAPLVSEKYLKQLIDNDYIAYVVSFVGIIIVGLVAIGLVNLLISQLFRVTGLSFINRLLGMVFGFIRGVILGAVAIWVIGLVPSWTKEKWFVDSALVPQYRKVTEYAMQYLPENLTEFIRSQQENPQLKQLKALADEKGIGAVLELLQQSDNPANDNDVQATIQAIKDMQAKEATQNATPDNTVQPLTRPNQPQTTPNANDSQQEQQKPAIQLESTE